jgi:hypothetical protein
MVSNITVPLSKWRSYVRLAVVWLTARFITSGFSAGTYPGHDPNEDRAVDFMVPAWQTAAGRAKGQKLADYLANKAVMSRLAGWYVIWWGRIWSMTRPEKGWLPYFDRNNTNPSRSHHNHVHFSFYDKAAKNPLYGTPSTPAPAAPKPYTEGWVPDKPWVFYLDRQSLGLTGSDSVWLIQKALGLKPYDGNYTQAVRDAVRKWQRDVLKDDPAYCDGILGRLQAKSLFNDAIDIEDNA